MRAPRNTCLASARPRFREPLDRCTAIRRHRAIAVVGALVASTLLLLAGALAAATGTAADAVAESVMSRPQGTPGRCLAKASVPERRAVEPREKVAATTLEHGRLVVREEGRFERETRPAEHVVHDVQALLADARSERIDVPAVPDIVERRARGSEASVERRPVPCEVDLTRSVVARRDGSADDRGAGGRTTLATTTGFRDRLPMRGGRGTAQTSARRRSR